MALKGMYNLITLGRPLDFFRMTMETTTILCGWRGLSGWIVLLFFGFTVFGQGAPVEGPAGPDGAARGRLLVTTAQGYFEGKVGRYAALDYAEEASRLAWAAGDSVLIVDADLVRGKLLNAVQHLPEATVVLERMLPVAERHAPAETVDETLDALGMVHVYRAHYDVALRYFFRSLSRRQAGDHAAATSIALHNVGRVFFKLKNYDKALDHYQRALAIKESLAGHAGADQLCMDISLCYGELAAYSEALSFAERGLRLCGGPCSTSVLYANAYARGVVSLGQKEPATAAAYFSSALQLADDAGDLRAEAESCIALANIALDAGDLDAATSYLSTAEADALPGQQNLLLADAYAGFIRLYKSQGNYERTTFYQEKFAQFRDSVFDERIAANLAETQATFEDQQNRLAIALKEEVIRQQRIQGIFIISGVVLLTIVVLILFKRVRRRRALRRMLEERVAERTALLEDSVQRWEAGRRVEDAALMARAALITSALVTMRKVCVDILDEGPDADTRECMDRMIAVIDEMEGALTDGIRGAVAGEF